MACLFDTANEGNQLLHDVGAAGKQARGLRKTPGVSFGVGGWFLKLDLALTFSCRHLLSQEIILVGPLDPIFSA